MASCSAGRVIRIAAVVAVGIAASGHARADGPPMRLSGMTFVASREDVTEIRVAADSGVIDEVANKAHLSTIHAEWAGADGKPSLELTCERGELDLETNDLVATGDVHGLLADGRRFVGPSLRFDRAKGVAFTDAPVEIIENGRVLSGGGFRYHVRDRRLRLTRGARVEENRTP